MGKNKAQRTKNNAKPSSSGRSAELLGASMPNFVGFSAAKDGSYIPLLPGLSITKLNQYEINTIDPNYQLVIKKMHKKDTTTKFKALQEFSHLSNDLPLSSVEAVLPFWPKLYQILSCDIEHRVREAAQLANGTLVKRLGRNIAQYLKQLAGPWFTSQFDTYPPAASAAINSLHHTFPLKKYNDAIVHCQDEILSYISNNIILQSPQTLNTNNFTQDQLETKYQRLLICNLNGYSSYFNNVTYNNIDKTMDIHREIISNGKFWKLSRHQSSLVKSAFYNVLASIINNRKDLIDNEKKRSITTIINSIDDCEPAVLSAVWQCMLMIIDKIHDWYNVVSIEKLLLPKLWRVLRNGGQGCANILYPNLLPIISQFSKFHLDNTTKLYIEFFHNMTIGFEIKTFQMIRSEMYAITKSFIECLRYTIQLYNNDIEFCQLLINDQLISIIQLSIKEYSSIKIILFNQVAELLHYWSKNRNDSSYSLLIITFWNKLQFIFQQLINDTNNEFDQIKINNIHDAQLQFLQSLKYTSDITCNNVHVTFADTPHFIQPKQKEQQSLAMKNILINNDEIFFNELNEFVKSLCIIYLNNVSQIPSTNTIVHLNRLLLNFESKELIISIVKAYRNNENLLDFYNYNMKQWLMDNNIKTMAIVEFLFKFIKYMNDDDKQSILNSIIQFNDNNILNCAIICILTEKNNRIDEIIRVWCCNNHITQYFNQVAKKFIIDDKYSVSDEHVLLMAFESIDGVIMVNDDAIDNISMILCKYLKKSTMQHGKRVVEFVSQLLKLTLNYNNLTNGPLIMLKTLFQLDIENKLSANIKVSIRNCWINAFSMISNIVSSDKLYEIKRDCIKIIYDKIYQLNELNIDEVINIAMEFIQSSNNNNYIDGLSMIIEYNCGEKDVYELWIPQITDIVLHAEIISGNFHLVNPIRSIPLDCLPTFIVPQNEKLPNRIDNCLQWALFNVKLFNKLILKLNIDIDSIVIECLSNLPHILNSILLITSLTKLYCKHYKLTINYDNINNKFNILAIECKKLRQCIPKCIWRKILNNTSDMKNYWMEFGSIFGEFLRYYYDSDVHLSQINVDGCEILTNYLKCENTLLTLVDHINAVVLARNLLDNVNNYSLCLKILERMINRHEIDRDFLLFNRDIGNVEWSNFCLPLEIIRLCTKFVNTAPYKMTTGMWDAVMIFLSSWQQTLNKSKYHHNDFKLPCLIASISQLFCAVQSLINKHKNNTIDELPKNLLDEWQNVFSDDSNRHIVNVWMYYSNLFNVKNNYLTPILILQYLGDAVKSLDGNTFFQSYNDYSTMTITSDQLMKFSFKLILSSVPSLQLAAYYSLNHLVLKLVEQDKIIIEQENFNIKSLNIYKFENTLLTIQKYVDKILMDYHMCEDVNYIVQPYENSYTYKFGYLLLWANVLNMCSYANANLRYQYGEVLKEQLYSCLMNNIFRLMPSEIINDNKTRIVSVQLMELFKRSPTLNFNDSLCELKLNNIVCWIYGNCLRYLPVLARQWWSTTDSRVSNIIERITTVYVSPILCQEELMNKKFNDVANLQVKVHSSAREVFATYEMDDTKLELTMILPINYPLGPVIVEPGQHAGNATIRRNCHKQLSIFLTHRNGSIWDALIMWKQNLDKKFSGVEECYICFSIFHINTSQIPKHSCHTCRKKFHAPCLYKWFSTSQKSTCPICRNIF